MYYGAIVAYRMWEECLEGGTEMKKKKKIKTTRTAKLNSTSWGPDSFGDVHGTPDARTRTYCAYCPAGVAERKKKDISRTILA